MFRFANTEYLYLLLIIPLIIVVYMLLSRRRKRLMARFGDTALVKELMPDYSAFRYRLKATLFITALALIIVAAARPQTGARLRSKRTQGVEIVLAVDVSNSMLSGDFEPSRLDKSKYAISQLLSELKNENIGLVVFADEAKVLYPISDDYVLARSFTKRISTSLIPEQGTNIAKALMLSINTFSGINDKSKAVVLITDGENHYPEALNNALTLAKNQGVTIHTIGIGTPEGTPIQINGQYIKDEEGNMVLSKLDEKALQNIAASTGGSYVRATKQDLGLSEIIKHINKMEKSAITKQKYEEYDELYIWPLWLALILLIVETIILPRRNHRIKRVSLFDPK